MGGHITGPHKTLILPLSPCRRSSNWPICTSCNTSVFYPHWLPTYIPRVWPLSRVKMEITYKGFVPKNMRRLRSGWWGVESREQQSSKWWWWNVSFQLFGVLYTDTAQLLAVAVRQWEALRRWAASLRCQWPSVEWCQWPSVECTATLWVDITGTKKAVVVPIALLENKNMDFLCSMQVCVLAPTQHECFGTTLGSLFSGLSNCTVNISPQNFVVNMNPPSAAHASLDLLDGIELENLM